MLSSSLWRALAALMFGLAALAPGAMGPESASAGLPRPGRPIACDTIRDGQLSSANYVEEWSFQGVAGQRVGINAISREGPVTVQLVQGNSVTEPKADLGRQPGDRGLEITLPEADTYTIGVFGPAPGRTSYTLSYAVRLRCAPPGGTLPPLAPPVSVPTSAPAAPPAPAATPGAEPVVPAAPAGNLPQAGPLTPITGTAQVTSTAGAGAPPVAPAAAQPTPEAPLPPTGDPGRPVVQVTLPFTVGSYLVYDGLAQHPHGASQYRAYQTRQEFLPAEEPNRLKLKTTQTYWVASLPGDKQTRAYDLFIDTVTGDLIGAEDGTYTYLPGWVEAAVGKEFEALGNTWRFSAERQQSILGKPLNVLTLTNNNQVDFFPPQANPGAAPEKWFIPKDGFQFYYDQATRLLLGGQITLIVQDGLGQQIGQSLETFDIAETNIALGVAPVPPGS